MSAQEHDSFAGISTLVELLRWRAQVHPEQPAYSFLADGEHEEASFTYGELDRWARALGARLQDAGLAGGRSLLLYPPGWEFVVAFFGCLYAGVTAVPVYFPRINRPMTRFRSIAADAEPSAVLTTATNPLERERWVAQVPELADLRWFLTDTVEDDEARRWTHPDIDGQTLAFLQYTSGSTSMPKGVMNTHANLLHNSELIQACLHPVPFRGVFWLPFYHDLGLIGGILQTLYRGGFSTLMPPVAFLQRPYRWLRAISQTGATISGGPNFAYELCVRKVTPEQRATLDLSSWQVAFNGAEPIHAETLQRFAEAFTPCGFRGTAFSAGYGLAEATLLVSGGPAEEPPVLFPVEAQALEQNRVVPVPVGTTGEGVQVLVGCGRIKLDQVIAIADPETLARCADGQVGEIWVKGSSVALGYWKNPEATEATFGARMADTGEGPFLRTGDLGFLLKDELFVTGRLKDLIIIRGRNIYPQDVEWTVEHCHPNVRQSGCAAFSITVAEEERLVIVQEVERARTPEEAEEVVQTIRQTVMEQHELEVYAVALLRKSTLPKTSSGKVQRRGCREAFLNGTLEPICVHYPTFAGVASEPASEAEEPAPSPADEFEHRPSRQEESIRDWLITRLAHQLGMPATRIDPRKPFASFGLGSLQAVSLAGDLQDWLGRPTSPTLVYQFPTIDALAQHLAEELSKTGAAESLDPLSDAPRTGEPVAIIGIGCRFPGADGPAAFWDLLRHGRDAIRNLSDDPAGGHEALESTNGHAGGPAARRRAGQGDAEADRVRRGGFLDAVDRFDAEFFGIMPREASRIDPQQRLLLEVAWEALEDAGQVPERLAGTPVGVFIGIATNDYLRLNWYDTTFRDPYSLTGNAFSIAANRISYQFDFRGPSLALDTACSSSLLAVHQACQSLASGESTIALAGGVNLILAPEVTESFIKAGFLASDARCKTFDARADGYVRSEGAGVVVLKPLSRAQADGDPIYAVIRGGAVNQDGRTNGLTAPSQAAQEAVIRAAYRRAGVRPESVQYVEAHGTGTLLGDPIEVKALGAVLGEGRPEGNRCAIGSVKTNIGHLEAAGGVAGLIKAALAIKHGEIPPSLHFQEPNPHIPFDQLPLYVPGEAAPWPEGPSPRLAGVSAFGFGGTNVHLVLEGEPTSATAEPPTAVKPARPYVLPLSARSPEALQDLARLYRDRLADGDADPAAFRDLAYSATLRRSHHDHRLALVASAADEAADLLQGYLRGEVRGGLAAGRRIPIGRPKLAFVFSGQGVSWVGVGRELIESEPVVRELIERCDRWLAPQVGWSLIDELRADGERSRLDRTEVSQPALFALQVGLAALWEDWGIRPDAIVGHSLGEVAAAHVAGALGLEDALGVVLHRSRLMQRVSGQGKTLAVGLGAEAARRFVTEAGGRLSIASLNAPSLTTLSGDPAAVEEAAAWLRERDIFVRVLAGHCAYHSPQMDPLRPELVESLRGIRPRPTSIPIVSTVTGRPIEGETLDAEYWGRNLREPVRFATALDRLAEGHEVFLELGPHPTLAPSMDQILHHREKPGVVLPTLHIGEGERVRMLRSLAKLYTLGFPIHWPQVAPTGRFVSLPGYPWRRQRHWIGGEARGLMSRWGEAGVAPAPHLNGASAEPHHHAESNGNGNGNGNGHAKANGDAAPWLDERLYELHWQPAEGPARSVASGEGGHWLIFADRAGLAESIREALEAAGDACTLVLPGDSFEPAGASSYRLDPTDPEGYQALIDATIGHSGAPCPGVLHLWSLDAGPADDASPGAIEEAQTLGAGSVLLLVQALARREPTGTTRAWAVTRGAQAVGDLARVPGLLQAPIWGLGRSLALEHPECWGGLIDLDHEAPDGEAAAVIDAVRAGGAETQQAIRGGRTFVPRLRPREMAVGPMASSLPIAPDGTYLVTGGLGDIGLAVARWLVEHGARRLVLVGRRGLPDRATWDDLPESSPARAQVEAVRDLERLGATVLVGRGDVADASQMEALFRQLSATLPPIRGVIHAAGVIHPKLALDLSADDLRATLRPKVAGGWVLDRLTRGLPLDFFVLFSSVSSVWGSGRLVDYAAANGFLDALAHDRRALGLPATSINWGPWGDLGMATKSELGTALKLIGLSPLPPPKAIDAIGPLVGLGTPQVTVADVDWFTFKVLYENGTPRPFLEQIPDRPRQAARPTASANHLLKHWREIPPQERRQWLIRYLRDRIGKVMGIEPGRLDIDRPLNTLGLGSLVAMELKNGTEADLGVALPLASLFQGPTITQLADQMLGLLEAPPTAPASRIEPSANKVSEHPLSFNQQSLWYLHRLAPDSPLYHISGGARISSRVHVDVLRRCFQHIVDRHAALRTTFATVGDQVVQRVHETMEAHFVVVDARGWTDAQLRRRMAEEAHETFDLDTGPLFRTHLFTRAEDEHFLLLSVSHTISDFWSIALLMNEMGQVYAALRAEREPRLPVLTLQYTDFVRWQSEMLAGPEGELHWNYWSKQLAGPLPTLNLPTDRPRPAVQSHNGAEKLRYLGETLTQRLVALGAPYGASLYITLLSAFQVLLSRYSGQDDIIVGSPVAGRNRPGLDGLVGDFVNTLPMRADLSGNPTFEAVLRRVRESVLDGLEHQDFPFPLMVDRLQPARDPSRSPLFQVMFVFQKAQVLDEQGMSMFALHEAGPKLELGELSMESVALDQPVSRFDLVMTTVLGDGRIAMLVEYNTDLFDESTIDRLMEHYRILLEGIVADPRKRLSDLPMLTQAEQMQLLQQWNSATAEPARVASEDDLGGLPIDLDGLSDGELDDLISGLSLDELGGHNLAGSPTSDDADANNLPIDLDGLSDGELDDLIASLTAEGDLVEEAGPGAGNLEG
jgi:acyl transferase domain-containing protein/acyl-CoA synthetase (AMP-forming)/AMP-acid ligase II/acyl carrier protein